MKTEYCGQCRNWKLIKNRRAKLFIHNDP